MEAAVQEAPIVAPNRLTLIKFLRNAPESGHMAGDIAGFPAQVAKGFVETTVPGGNSAWARYLGQEEYDEMLRARAAHKAKCLEEGKRLNAELREQLGLAGIAAVLPNPNAMPADKPSEAKPNPQPPSQNQQGRR